MMNETILTIADTDLGSRHAAAKFRALVEKCALAGNKVVLDLGTVLSISESYADELFGVLVARHGLEWFAQHIAFRATDPAVFRVIAMAIRYRLEVESPENSEVALLAARKALRDRQQSAA
jgi:hypothetical protein